MENYPPEHDAGIPLSAALACVGGYTDAATFVITGIFAGHISGNCVLAPISAVTRNWEHAVTATAAVIVIVLGISASSALDAEPVRRSRVPPLTLALLAETALFLIAGIPFVVHRPFPHSAGLLLLCFAMGIQTGALRRTKGVSVYTAFMAGMVTRLSEGETDRLQGRRDSPAENNVPILAKLFAAFMVGAFGGAAMAVYVRPYAYFAGGIAVLVLALLHTTRAVALGPEVVRRQDQNEGRRPKEVRGGE